MVENTSKTERTKAHIIATTAPIFNKKGYSGTSITDLTKASKLTSGSIYGNFANKEEVALAAFEYNMNGFRQVLKKASSTKKAAKDKLLMYIKAFHSSSNSDFSEGGCPMINTLVDADDTCEPLRKKAAEALMLWKKDLVEIIHAGKAAREIRSDADANKTAWHIIALCEFAITMYSATKTPKESDAIVNMALEVAKDILV